MGTPSSSLMPLLSDSGTSLTMPCPWEGRRELSLLMLRRLSSTRRGPRRPTRSTRRGKREQDRAGSSGSVHDRSCSCFHLLQARTVRQIRRLCAGGQGTGVLPEEDQGQEGTIDQ